MKKHDPQKELELIAMGCENYKREDKTTKKINYEYKKLLTNERK